LIKTRDDASIDHDCLKLIIFDFFSIS